MSNDKFFDFDEFMEERGGGTFTIKAFGEVHELPNEVPFDIILRVTRAHKNKKKQMSDDDTIEMAKTLLTEKTFDRLVKKGITLKQIMLLMEKVMEMYTKDTEEAVNSTKGNTP